MQGAGPSNLHRTGSRGPQYDPVNLTIKDRWVLQEMLGTGSYGTVHKAFDKETNTTVAVKMETYFRDASTKERVILKDEYEIMKALNEAVPENKSVGFPRPIYFANSDFMRVMVMELLGKTVFETFKNRFPSLEQVYHIGIQVLSRLEYMHELGFVHLDLKSDNIFFGRDEYKNHVYLADFGLSERYLNSNQTHRANTKREYRVGTQTFASRHVRDFHVPSRRDDVESLSYVLIWMYFKALPWRNGEHWQSRHSQRDPERCHNLLTSHQGPEEVFEVLEESTLQNANRDVNEMKKNYELDKLCRGMPGMKAFLEYARALNYSERPDYSFLRATLRRKIGYQCQA